MTVGRPIIKIYSAFLLLLFSVFLSACNVATTPSPISSVKRSKTPVTTSTFTPVPTTPTPTLTPTPVIWEIQTCYKGPSVVDNHDSLIWGYTGNMDGRSRVDMLLNFTENNEILGFLFDFEQVREYKVTGCVEERTFTMWLQEGDAVAAVIKGEFPGNSIDGITGLLMKKGDLNHSIYLDLESGLGGTMQHRFEEMGVDDDTVILDAAHQFLTAVADDDRNQVVKNSIFLSKFRLSMNGKY